MNGFMKSVNYIQLNVVDENTYTYFAELVFI